MKQNSIVTTFLGCMLLAWACISLAAESKPPSAATSAPGQPITAAEQSRLLYCTSLSIDAYVIAGYKLHGDPKQVAKDFYASSPSAHALLPLVDTIYGDASVRDPWSYAGAFYQDCAEQLAMIAPDRSALTVPCLYETLIAATARTARAAGTPKQKVYALYADLGLKARRIIDGIYAPATVPAEGTELQLYSSCMVPLSTKD